MASNSQSEQYSKLIPRVVYEVFREAYEEFTEVQNPLSNISLLYSRRRRSRIGVTHCVFGEGKDSLPSPPSMTTYSEVYVVL
ncbi:hypothetical protein RB195_010044 [Necator americanus]|uniref:Uncharacterized protein n=1 Tax=Necator americanus TaxID=51031 RepID=A0ABR1CXD3_NECAM